MLWLRSFTTSCFAIMCFSGWRLLSEVSAACVSFRGHARFADVVRTIIAALFHFKRWEPKMAEAPSSFPTRPSSYDKKIGLVLQGGGALGSSEYLPDWVAGISIGAINAAIIAGNAPEDRLERLRSFWNNITGHPNLWP